MLPTGQTDILSGSTNREDGKLVLILQDITELWQVALFVVIEFT